MRSRSGAPSRLRSSMRRSRHARGSCPSESTSSAFTAPTARPPGPPWRLLHVGSLNRVKDHPTLLAAFAEIAAVGGDVSLDCVGEDTLGGEMQALARRLGIAGARPVPRVRAERSARAILPPRPPQPGDLALREPVGLRARGSGGRPADGGNSRRVVDHDGAGGGVDGSRPAIRTALAAAVTSLLARPATARVDGRAAQAFARAHDVTDTVRAFDDIYRSLLASGGRRRCCGGSCPPQWTGTSVPCER